MALVRCLLLAVLLLACMGSGLAQDDVVEGMLTDERGINYIMHEGERWTVMGKGGAEGRLFIQDSTKLFSERDPRKATPAAEQPAAAEAPQSAADRVRGVQKDDQGRHYLKTDDDQTWLVYSSPEDKAWFYHEATQTSQWHDPREPAPEPHVIKVDSIDEAKRVLRDAAKANKKSSKKAKAAAPPPPSPWDRLKVGLVVTIPVMLFISAVAGRIYYLHTYYPEVLFPTKVRKERKKGSAGFKPQKARGKMSQDGKGGRSANS